MTDNLPPEVETWNDRVEFGRATFTGCLVPIAALLVGFWLFLHFSGPILKTLGKFF